MEIQNANIIRAVMNGIVFENFKRNVKLKIFMSEPQYNPTSPSNKSDIHFNLDSTDFEQYLKEENLTYPICGLYSGGFAFITDIGTFCISKISRDWELLKN